MIVTVSNTGDESGGRRWLMYRIQSTRKMVVDVSNTIDLEGGGRGRREYFETQPIDELEDHR